MQIAINRTYGGFKLHEDILKEYNEVKGTSLFTEEILRNDTLLIELITKYKDRLPDLKIVDIPDDVEWTIEDYDGMEWVAEVHRRWW